MRSYEELEANAYKKAEQIINNSKCRNRIMLRRFLVSTLGVAAIIGIGICANALRPPKKPIPESSDIIIEPATVASSETTVKTSVQTEKSSTNAVDNSKTTVTSVTGNNSFPDSTTTNVTSIRSVNNTDTTIAHSRQTSVQSRTATTSSFTTQTTVGTEAKTTNSLETNTTATGETTPIEYWRRVYYGEDNTIYRTCSRDNEQITAAISDVGEYFGDAILAMDLVDPLTNKKTRTDTSCQLFAYKHLSPEYVCAVKENGSTEFTLYRADADFGTLGEFIEGTDIEDMLVLKEAYYGYIEADEAPIGYPDNDSLMKALSNPALESRSSSVLKGSISYTIYAEIPELGALGPITLLKDGNSGYISFDILGNKSTFDIGSEKLDEFISSFTE